MLYIYIYMHMKEYAFFFSQKSIYSMMTTAGFCSAD